MSLRPLLGVSLASALALAPAASARPLTLGLGLPALTLFGQVPIAVPPPPVVLPPGPPLAPGAASASRDVLRLRDGRTVQGKILYPVQSGLLFHDAASRQTYVVPFSEVVDVQPSQPGSPAAPAFAPDRRLFLEAQLREVQARYDALSIWPAIEELVAGVLGVGGGILLFALTGDVIDDVFTAILGLTGLVSLIVGVVEMASVVHRENVLKEQIDQLQTQLGQLRSENFPALPPLLAIEF